ncbi:MAG TPA: DUF2264 domain-containing protein [Candidatus Acidoferrum sp.]|nr:DUF2264 domain-containing protein [Candidatus Acidoferrum sp.]
MNTRRAFLGQLSAISTVAAASPLAAADAQPAFTDDRAYWLSQLMRVAEPVLANMAANRLKETMPVEAPAVRNNGRRAVTHLEALGRTLTGIAPWLELVGKIGGEREHGRRFAELARRSIENATDPKAADAIDFNANAQNLVDAAFLAHALLRARRELWEKLDPAVRKRVVAALQSTRKFKPGANNWLLFSAIIEVFLATVAADWNEAPIQLALDSHEKWYKGDGVYGDGAEFHWDYYNSYVIQPMLIDVVENIGRVTPKWNALSSRILARAKRYAAIQERLIAPDGTFPVVGRSIVYRCGAFQLLAQMALRNELPERVSAAQVRSALSAVIHRTLGATGTFDANGWLQVGLGGHQPALAETYISTGSLYLCSSVFLPLGLPDTNPFWSARSADWTAKKVWAGQNLPADHSMSRA